MYNYNIIIIIILLSNCVSLPGWKLVQQPLILNEGRAPVELHPLPANLHDDHSNQDESSMLQPTHDNS